MSFSNKRVLVTGGANGLGRAIVQKFHDEEANVVAFDKDLVALETLKSELPAVITVHVDLLDWKAVGREMELRGPFDHLVNNAGVLPMGTFMDIQEADVDLVFGVNFKGSLNVSQIFAKGVIAAGIKGTSIVNISSVGDRISGPGCLAYGCSKAAVTMMTKCMAKELGPHGIRVNCIRPTAMMTNLFTSASKFVVTEKFFKISLA